VSTDTIFMTVSFLVVRNLMQTYGSVSNNVMSTANHKNTHNINYS